MDLQPVLPTRIIVLARPDLARHVESVLRDSGHEVYRTPDASGVATLVARLRPHLVIIASDIPWADATETPHDLASRMHDVPVLLIGEINGDGHAIGIPHLAAPIDDATLQSMVTNLLVSSRVHHPD
jgi:hypothetical protein